MSETGRTFVGGVGNAQLVGGSLGGDLTADKLLPRLVGLVDNLDGVLLGLGLTRESKDVLGLSIGDLVDPEPLVGGPDETGQVPLDILNVVQSGSKRVVDVNDNDLPVGLTLIEKSHDSEDLDLLDLANVSNGLTDLTDVQWVIVTLGLGLGVLDVGVFPSLRESTIVPDVPVVREAVSDKPELALLGVLLDGVQSLLLGDFHLGVGPSGNLDNHVQDSLGLISEQGNVVESRDGLAVLLEEDSVLERVGGLGYRGHVSPCVRETTSKSKHKQYSHRRP